MKRILIAEDDAFLVQIYESKLSQLDYEVVIVTDGDAVLTSIAEQLPDVLVLDIMLPKMNGFDILNTIKSTPQYTHIPVLIASNLGQREDFEKAKELGASEYLVKSQMGIGEIVSVVVSYLT